MSKQIQDVFKIYVIESDSNLGNYNIIDFTFNLSRKKAFIISKNSFKNIVIRK